MPDQTTAIGADVPAFQQTVSGRIGPEELRRIVEVCERAARGDLEARIVETGGIEDYQRLCLAINRMLDMADSFVREAAAAMHECSHERFHRPILLRGLHGGYRSSAKIINDAGAKMMQSHAQLKCTANLASETARNVQEIANACDHLNSLNSEVSRQAADSANLTESAVVQAKQAQTSVQSLQSAMNKIEAMLSVIDKIAAQTNLLALNATIEAARVGEHGRGFAVVADEVKDLSRSSARGARDIAQQVDAMRALARETAGCIEGVNRSMDKINESASKVAGAAQKQCDATADISRNITAASLNSARISENIKTGSARD